MGGYLYFSNNLKDIKDHIYICWYDKLQNIFPINGNSLKEKLNL